MSHEASLALAAGEDDEALALLVRAHHDRVYRFGRRVCRDGFDADDAVQEAFVKLARRPDMVQETGVVYWLLRVVRNACIRMLRPYARERKTLGERLDTPEEAPSDDLDPHAALVRWQLVSAVHQAVATLDRQLREVLVMRDLEGLSGDHTCAALGITEAAMKNRLHRARAELRRELERLND
jgi:RNA polymerase sigma-70 factor (ECF subfamily)